MGLDKEQIAQTFEEHFIRDGWEATTLDGVAQTLNISKQVLYRHLHPESIGYDVDLERFKAQLGEKRADGIDAERLFEERVKSSLREYLRCRNTDLYESALRMGLDCRDDQYEKLLYLVHGVMTIARQLPNPSSGFGRVMSHLPKLVRSVLGELSDEGPVDLDEASRRIADMLQWSAELVRSEELDASSTARLQDEVSEGVLQALGVPGEAKRESEQE